MNIKTIPYLITSVFIFSVGTGCSSVMESVVNKKGNNLKTSGAAEEKTFRVGVIDNLFLISDGNFTYYKPTKPSVNE